MKRNKTLKLKKGGYNWGHSKQLPRQSRAARRSRARQSRDAKNRLRRIKK